VLSSKFFCRFVAAIKVNHVLDLSHIVLMQNASNQKRSIYFYTLSAKQPELLLPEWSRSLLS